MRLSLTELNKEILRTIKIIGQAADKKEISAYVVGGFVRDIILKRKNLDLDIVVEADAISVAQELSKKYQLNLTIYSQFGTATLTFPKGLRVDLATARKEYYPRSGALPVVEPGIIKDDLFRRDFTINAMAAVINTNRLGELVDCFGGLDDVRNKKIRVLHDKSFIDDPTRILRAVRFEQRFDFAIERNTLTLFKSALKAGVVDGVKPARYFEEFKKILSEPDPTKYMVRLDKLNALRFLGKNFKPDFHQLHRMEQNKRSLPPGLYCFDNKEWLIYFMTFIPREESKRLVLKLNQYHFDRYEIKAVLETKGIPKIIKFFELKKVRPSQIYRKLYPLTHLAIIYLRLSTSSKLVHKRIDDYGSKYSLVSLNINGEDLKKLGIATNRKMGYILNSLLYQKIDGLLHSREEELKEARRLSSLNLEKMSV